MTTLDIPPKDVLEIYRSRDVVEHAFRITKETIMIRPIRNRMEEHAKAHLFICFLAYLLISLIELEGRRHLPGITGVKFLDKLRVLTKRPERDVDTG